MTGDGTYTYQWDAEGRLISVNSGVDRSYVYNALGREVEWHGDGRVSEDLTDLAGHYLGSVDPSSGAWTGERIPGSSIYLAWYVNGGTTFFHYNALGSSIMNTRQDGNTVSNDILFYPWGQLWASPVNDYFQFFGNIEGWDWEIGEGVAPNRFYPNYQGRWLSPDPLAGDISNPQSLNRYAYALNNPTTFTDPSGLCFMSQATGGCVSPQQAYQGAPPLSYMNWQSAVSGYDYVFSVFMPNQIGEDDPADLHWSVDDPPSFVDIRYDFAVLGGGGGVGAGGGCGSSKQQLINKALKDLMLNLVNDPECMAFLRSNGKDPIVEMTMAKFTSAHLSPGIGAVTDFATSTVTINSTGSFFSPAYYAGGVFRGGTTQAQNLILLHETGHLTDAIVPNDYYSRVQQDANNLAIISHCQKALGIK